MMKFSPTLISLSIAIASGLGLQSCASSGEDTQKLVLTGSSTVAPVASEIAKRFEDNHPEVRIDVQTGGSSRGIADAREGLADLGMASRALKPEESDLNSFTIARDGVGVVVHQSNPVSGLDKSQIIDIYTGEIDNWQQVGGNDSEITVINKAEGRGTLEVFLDYLQIENSQVEADSIVGHNQQSLKTVAANPNAIAYISIGVAQESIDEGIAVKLVAIDGIEASLENVQTGRYPVSRPLNFIAKDRPEGLAQSLVEFAQSPDVSDIVKEQGYVPVSP